MNNRIKSKSKLGHYSWVALFVINIVIIVVSFMRHDWGKLALFSVFALISSAEIVTYRRQLKAGR